MRILVTGCCGFIGFNFTKHLIENTDYEVIGIDSLQSNCSIQNKEILLDKNISLIEDSILNINSYEIKNVDAVVNFAAETHVDNSIFRPEKFVESNILGLVELLKFCQVVNVEKIIHVSTDEVYGSNKEGFMLENSNFNPSSPYSASKASAELMIQSYQKTYGINITTVRPANNYGIFQQPEKLIPFSIANLLNGRDIELYGDGSNIRHWLHVDDTVSAILKLLNNDSNNEIFNIGSGYYLTNLEVAKKLINILNLNEDRIKFVEDRPAHDFRYAVDFNKLLSTGWTPNSHFEEELEKIVFWYESNKIWWKSEYENIISKNRKKRFKLTENG